MATPLKEYEGAWEEILTHSDDLAGHKVRVIVLPSDEAIRARNQAMLAVLDELDRNPWTPEEMAVLDGFEPFQKENPFRIRQIEDKS